MKVDIADSAKADLIGIGKFISQDNPARAATYVQELLDHCERLGDFPLRHGLVQRYERFGVRRCVHDEYLIFYRVQTDHVVVIHILRGSMDYEAILFPEE